MNQMIQSLESGAVLVHRNSMPNDEPKPKVESSNDGRAADGDMRTACSRATVRNVQHPRFVHADKRIPRKQRSESTIKLTSGDAAQLDDGQVLAPGAVVDREFKPRTATPVNLRVRSSAWRAPRPASSWLESWREARWRSSETNLVRSLRNEPTVRSISVVPGDEVVLSGFSAGWGSGPRAGCRRPSCGQRDGRHCRAHLGPECSPGADSPSPVTRICQG